ncbi:MAG TPA: glutathione S-transferase family protein [Polyangiaceae bacterium]|nr:glutathione S-transferase family protein [Polyangiaceae bacterium]
MLRLHGFSSSNYYNIVKLALLEKGLAFEEVVIYTGASDEYHPEYLAKSPLGKVPCLETEQGFLTESRCIVAFLDDAFPERPLLPADPFARAKVHEVTQVIDLYLELAARRLLPNYFTSTQPPPAIANDVKQVTAKGARALARLARFDGYAMGDRFGAADVACAIHLPAVRRIMKSVLDHDPLAFLPALDGYLERMEQRDAVKRVRADHGANLPEFLAHLKARYGVSR